MTTATRIVIPRLSKRDAAHPATDAAQPPLLDTADDGSVRAYLAGIANNPRVNDGRRAWAKAGLAMLDREARGR
jgi:hypothetical protein